MPGRPQPSTARSPRLLTSREFHGVVVGASCLAALVFANTLGADFAYDDSRAIKSNPDVLPSSSLFDIFQHDFWGTPLSHSGSHGSYRPLVVLSYRLNVALGGMDPRWFHAGNVMLHVVTTALFTGLARAVTGGRLAATVVSSALFAVHPVHCEAVAGLVGRADLLASCLALLALGAYRRYRTDSSRHWLHSSLGLAAAATLCKEHAVTVLALCALHDLLVARPAWSLPLLLWDKKYQGLKEGLVYLTVTAFLLVLLRLQLMGFRTPEFSPADNPAADCDGFLSRTLTFLFLPAFNGWLLLCPRVLSFDWSMEAIPLISGLLDRRNLLTAAFYGGVLGLLLLAFQRSALSKCSHLKCSHPDLWDAVIFSWGFLVIPFLPATNLFFYVGFVVAERVLYMPSMGFCLLVGLGAEILWTRLSPRCRYLVPLACLVILSAMGLRTVVRNVDWRTEENLYRSGIPVNPPKAYGNLGNILSGQGKKAEAEWAYRRALSFRANMADVHYNLGNLLHEEGRMDEALHSYQAAVQFRPRLAMAFLNMGLVLETLGHKEEAIGAFRKCAGLDGNGLKDPRLHESTRISALFHLGRSYAEQLRFEEAIEVYLLAVRRMPDHYQPHSLYNMLGEAYFKLDRFADAEFWYQEALRAKPDHVPALLTYAKLLSKWDKPSEAEMRFRAARRLAPNDSSVYQHYGQFLSEHDRHHEAADLLTRAAHLAPDHYEIIFNAANTLRQAGRHLEAERYYKMAVKLRPNEVVSHMNLGAMLHLNGKLLEAEGSYLEALRLRPDDVTTKNNLKKLRHLLSQRGVRPVHSQR